MRRSLRSASPLVAGRQLGFVAPCAPHIRSRLRSHDGLPSNRVRVRSSSRSSRPGSVLRVHGRRAVRAGWVLHHGWACGTTGRFHHVARGRAAVRGRRRPIPRCRVAPDRPTRPVHRGRCRRRPRDAGAFGVGGRTRLLDGDAVRRRRRVGVAACPAPRRRRVDRALPDGPFDGVIIANELLDNLPFRLAVFDDGWREAFVVELPDGRLVEQLSAPLRPGAVGPADGRAARGAGADSSTPPGSGWPSAASSAVRIAGRRSTTLGDDRRARPSVRGGSGCAPTEATSGAATIWPTPAARTSPPRWRSTNCRTRHRSQPGPVAATTRHRRAGRRGQALLEDPCSKPRPGGDQDAQPCQRGRGPARRRRPRSVHRVRVAQSRLITRHRGTLRAPGGWRPRTRRRT